MTLTQITEKGIKDGEIINADINASAAIAGSKISPTFTSNVTISNNDPSLIFTDGDANPDFKIRGNGGTLKFIDTTNNNADRMAINSDGHVDVYGNLDVGAGLDVTGTITSTGIGQFNNTINLNHASAGSNIIYFNEDLQFSKNGTGTRIKIDSDGKVGIGTTTIGEKLTLGDGDLKFFHSNAGNSHRTTFIEFGNSSNRITSETNYGSDNSSNYTAGLKFTTKNFNGSSFETKDALNIQANGNVGIGDTSPTKPLTIGTTTPTILLDDGSGRTVELVGGSTSTGPEVRTTYSEDLRFGTNSQERMRVDTSGRLLIGTTSAGTANLAVKGTTNAWGGAGNATHSVGAKLVLEDDQGRQAAMWAPKAADAAVGTITNHHFFIATGNANHTFFNHTTGNVEINDGNLKVASGHGIDFSDAGNASGMSSELLDDYEEGTWTPVWNSGSASTAMWDSCGYANTQGSYTKIGNQVFYALRIQATNIVNANSGSHVILAGLPFSSNSSVQGSQGGAVFGYSQAVCASNNGYLPTMHIPMNSSHISFYTCNGNTYQVGDGNNQFLHTLHLHGQYTTA